MTYLKKTKGFKLYCRFQCVHRFCTWLRNPLGLFGRPRWIFSFWVFPLAPPACSEAEVGTVFPWGTLFFLVFPCSANARWWVQILLSGRWLNCCFKPVWVRPHLRWDSKSMGRKHKPTENYRIELILACYRVRDQYGSNMFKHTIGEHFNLGLFGLQPIDRWLFVSITNRYMQWTTYIEPTSIKYPYQFKLFIHTNLIAPMLCPGG